MIKEKEAKIIESERAAKDLLVKAEEFEDMFVGESLICSVIIFSPPMTRTTCISLFRPIGDRQEPSVRP